MMGDDDIVSTSDTAPAVVHAEQSNHSALKYRGILFIHFVEV